jgi:hypothetical protein
MAAAEAEEPEPWLHLTAMKVEPNRVPFDVPFTIEVAFEAKQEVERARWIVEFLVDYAAARHRLGSSRRQD